MWLRRLASMKLAVGLLAVILAALAAGTILESVQGTATAHRVVYGAIWFRLLLAFLAANVVCSLIDRRPWGRARIGFVLTHAALLVILAGALVTAAFKLEGQLALWEGEETSTFTAVDGREVALPFSVRLEAFEIDVYPGTQRPAMFRSRVAVFDAARAVSFPAVIEMNQGLAYAGFRLFQSSYEQTPHRDRTILAVSRDPGQPLVFTGYFLLLAGMLLVLATRIAARRAIGGTEPVRVPAKVAAAGALIALASVPGILAAGPMPDPATVDLARRLAVQHDGRALPLDTLAREAVWNVTRGGRWRSEDPVATVLGWAFHPDAWAQEPMVALGGPALAAACGVTAQDGHASFQQLVANACVIGKIREARGRSSQGGSLSRILAEAAEIDGRLQWMNGFFQRDLLRVIPRPEDPLAEWSALPSSAAVSDFLALVDRPPRGGPPRAALEREIVYNRVQPSRLACWVLIAASLLSIAAWSRPRRWLDLVSVGILATAFVVMTWGILARWAIAERIPATNMYESLLFLGWGVALFALAAAALLRSRFVLVNAAAMSALTMGLAGFLPLDRFIHPVPPVLAGTAWLAIHVPIIMLSYSVLALGVFAAHAQIGVQIVSPGRQKLVGQLNELLYWYVQIGSILLVAGILTGSMWASSSWGRYWGWDPKEVWSLVAFLAYVAILHGRFDRWLGPFGVAAASIGAFWTILMTYVGVNFVLATGLHSYGFGSSAVGRWLVGIACAEVAFLLAGWGGSHGWAKRRLRAA